MDLGGTSIPVAFLKIDVWSICVLCQRDGQNLVAPCTNLNPDVCAYSTLARNIDALINKGLPNMINVVLTDLNDDTNLRDNLKENKAQWHKGCQAELAPSKFKRALDSTANKKRRFENYIPKHHLKEHVLA